MTLQNLKISTRLMLGFGLMALLILVMSGTTTFFTNRADEQFHIVTEDRLPKVINLHVLKEGVVTAELALAKILLDPAPANVKEQEDLIQEKRKQITRLFDELSKSITSAEGRRLLDETVVAR